MFERLLIIAGLSVLGLALFQGLKWWSLRRTARLQAAGDPLLTDFRPGRPGILFFTADFCSTCKLQQVPALYRLSQQIGRGNVQIIEIDAQAQAADAARWGVWSLPATFVLDANGQPQAVNYGLASTETLRRQLERAGGA